MSTVGFGILQSSKSQARNPKEATSTKLQNDRPLMLDKGSAVAGRPSCPGRLWDLKLGACLELGVWSLELYQPTHSKSVARAKAVTSRTPSPHSKTWRQIRRFMESLHDFEIAHWDQEPAGGASVLASRLVSSVASPHHKGKAHELRCSTFRLMELQ